MLACDLHVHSSYSRDGESSVEEILLRAEKAGLDVIAITDHDTVEGVL
jgi:predicted metal-dependent phosphoesterase TrpH